MSKPLSFIMCHAASFVNFFLINVTYRFVWDFHTLFTSLCVHIQSLLFDLMNVSLSQHGGVWETTLSSRTDQWEAEWTSSNHRDTEKKKKKSPQISTGENSSGCTMWTLVMSLWGYSCWGSPCPKLGGEGVGTARGRATPLLPLFSLPPLPPLLPLQRDRERERRLLLEGVCFVWDKPN